MSKDPAVLWYSNDFLSGTYTMTDEQVGKYVRLLCLQHQNGFLTEQDMKYICKTYDIAIYRKFIKDGDKYYNRRMKDESEKRQKYSESRKSNRNKGLTNKSEKSYVRHMENENENINEDINIIDNRNKKNNNDKNEKNEKNTIPPPVELVSKYFLDKGFINQTERFIDFYESKNWYVGKNKMKDWQAAIRNWIRDKKPEYNPNEITLR